jgi:hypothetical protein
MPPYVAYCSCKLEHITRLKLKGRKAATAAENDPYLLNATRCPSIWRSRQSTVNFHEHSTACCRALGRSGSDVHTWPAAMSLTTSGTCKGVEGLCMCLRPS